METGGVVVPECTESLCIFLLAITVTNLKADALQNADASIPG